MIDALLAAAVAHITALQGAEAPLGYAIPRVDSYDGQVNEAQLADLLHQTPAVFVALSSARADERGSQRRWTAQLSILVVTRNLATHAAAREGTDGQIGAWRIVEDLALAFDGQKLGLDIAPLEPLAISPLVPGWARTQKAAIVGLTFATSWTVPIADPAGPLSDFLRVHADWNVGGDAAPEYYDDVNTR